MSTVRMIAIAAVAALLVAVPAQAQVTFSDDFTVSANSEDINFEYDLGRQGGSVAPLTYLENPAVIASKTQVGHPNAPGVLTFFPGYIPGQFLYASPDHNFTEGGNFEISVDVDPEVPVQGTSGNWTGVTFGTTDPAVGNHWGTDGICLILRDNGGLRAWDNGADTGDIAGPAGHGGYYNLRIVVDTAGFSGSSATIDVYVDGVNYWHHVRAAGFTANYISMVTEDPGGPTIHNAYDNFSVTVIPEPSTFVSLFTALGFGGMAMVRRRLRR